ncbi:hypothetical protein HAU32_08025 [Weissella confusa]|uniref:Mga helix-turn-helix domain-containing protein n=1 Tax=Weissella fermenti TaxID=2987699 RepID=A0ABT6D3N6_9LACO|nr:MULTISPECIES: hypothetical protein [Weissella]MBJ7688919.1 hypothetical protein [Weissella confusa]MCW0927144.1 hypothetical protein [Weissella sp. LMG 11983]MDF9299584.1 hypothetical protein [Weissella sp. BK2]
MIEWIFGKREYEKIQLLNLLVANENQTSLISDLMRQLRWSKYLVLSVIEEVAIDLQDFYKDHQNLLILSSDRRIVTLVSVRQINVEALAAQYFHRTASWQMLISMLNETMHSYTYFAEHYLCAVGTARNTKVMLEKNLAKYNVVVSNDYHLKARSESRLRLMFVDLFRTYWCEKNTPFDTDTEKMIAETMSWLYKEVAVVGALQISAIQEIKIYLGVLFLRVKKRHFTSVEWVDEILQDNERLTGSSKVIVQRLTNQLISQIGISADVAQAESRHFLVFLYALGIFADADEYLCVTDDLTRQQDKLVEVVTDEVKALSDFEFSNTQINRLRHYLTPKLIQLSAKYDVRFSEYDKATVKEGFPEIDYIVGRIIDKFRMSIAMEEGMINNALYMTLSMLICLLCQKERLFPPIRLEVDLPGLPGTRQIIINIILGMPEYNVVVSTQHDSEIDVVISNANRQDVAQQNLFEWQGLPTNKQLQQLRVRLRELRFEKVIKRIKNVKTT